jgi:hypothetical protein
MEERNVSKKPYLPVKCVTSEPINFYESPIENIVMQRKAGHEAL